MVVPFTVTLMETPSREFGGVVWSGLVVEARSVPKISKIEPWAMP
jgi:hypothetical protein